MIRATIVVLWALLLARAGAGCDRGDPGRGADARATDEGGNVSTAPSRETAADAEEAEVLRFERAGDVDALAAAVAGPSIRGARLALAALGRLGGEGAFEHIVTAMMDARAEVRSAAVRNYALGPGRARAAALARLVRQDTNASVRATAAVAIGKVRAYNEMDALLAAMTDDADLSVRRGAAESVWAIFGRRSQYDAEAPLASRRTAVSHVRDVWARDKEHIGEFYDMKRRAER